MPNVLVTGGAMIAMGKYWASDYPGLALPAVLGVEKPGGSSRVGTQRLAVTWRSIHPAACCQKATRSGLPARRNLSRSSGIYAGSAGTDRSPTPAWDWPMPQAGAFLILITVLARFIFFQTRGRKFLSFLQCEASCPNR
jgi:hypothetical protein